MRASVGLGAFSGIIQRLPARCAPGMRFSLQRIPTRRGDMPHFSATSKVDRYLISELPSCKYNNHIIFYLRNNINGYPVNIAVPEIAFLQFSGTVFFVFLHECLIFQLKAIFCVYSGETNKKSSKKFKEVCKNDNL